MIRFFKCIVKLQLIFNLIISKPISPTKPALVCLQIPIVQKNRSVKCINSKPPCFHTKLITKFKKLSFHPIDIYMCRPIMFEELTFMCYCKQ